MTNGNDSNGNRSPVPGDFNYPWEFFLVCEERQKSYANIRNVTANLILVISGAILTFISEDGIGGDDLAAGIILAALGFFGFMSSLKFDIAIQAWEDLGAELLTDLDEKMNKSYSKKYSDVEPSPSGKGMGEFLTKYAFSKSGAYVASSCAVMVLGVIISLVAYKVALMEFVENLELVLRFFTVR